MKIVKYNKGYDVYITQEDDNLPNIVYKGKILKPYLKRSNTRLQYPIVNVPNHGENYVHLIVAYAFHTKDYYEYKNKGERFVVDHINGNTLDYRPDNLHYILHKDNIKKKDGHMNPNIKGGI